MGWRMAAVRRGGARDAQRIAVACALAWVTLAGHALAQSSAQEATDPFVEVRLTVSAAAERFGQQRFRRLLAIELEDMGHVSAQTSGPLGDHVALVWIDMRGADQVAIQVRLAAHPAAQRVLSIANMRGDVAERVVALATAEMIRNQARPDHPKKAASPKENDTHDASPDAGRLGIMWSAEAAAASMPGSSAWIAGPGGSVGFVAGPIEQQMFARWLAGGMDGSTIRWFEAGMGARRMVFGRPAWRLSLGASAAAAILRMVGAQSVGTQQNLDDTWTARLAGRVGWEGRIGATAWLGISLEPGAVLHNVPYTSPSGQQGEVSGAWLGLAFSLSVEHALRSNGASAR
jgi:hypothetical protein